MFESQDSDWEEVSLDSASEDSNQEEDQEEIILSSRHNAALRFYQALETLDFAQVQTILSSVTSLEKGVILNCPNRVGKNPLEIAVDADDLDLATLFLIEGAPLKSIVKPEIKQETIGLDHAIARFYKWKILKSQHDLECELDPDTDLEKMQSEIDRGNLENDLFNILACDEALFKRIFRHSHQAGPYQYLDKGIMAFFIGTNSLMQNTPDLSAEALLEETLNMIWRLKLESQALTEKAEALERTLQQQELLKSTIQLLVKENEQLKKSLEQQQRVVAEHMRLKNASQQKNQPKKPLLFSHQANDQPLQGIFAIMPPEVTREHKQKPAT